MSAGVAYALGAYAIWGLLPIYLHALRGVDPGEILAHRIVWSLATMAILLLALRRLAWIAALREAPAAVLRFFATSALVTVNWLVFIWAVQHGRTVDASLGYYMNPLVSLVLGWLLLGERLRPGQIACVAILAAAVAWLTWQAGSFPWIGLSLAFSFALYGLLRKTAPLGSLEGFALEVVLLFPFALGYLAWMGEGAGTAFGAGSAGMRTLLVLAGPLTAIPLLLFTAGARRIPLSRLGILQYTAPTLQWLTGIFVFHEALDPHKALGFGVIWLALALFALESAWVGWQQKREAEASP